MATDQPERSMSRMLWNWGCCAAAVVFLWFLLSAVSRTWNETFATPLRPGAVYQTTGFVLLSPGSDQLTLFASSLLIVALAAARSKALSHVRRAVLVLPAVVIAVYPLHPGVLLPVGGLGTIAVIVYLLFNSQEVMGVSPSEALATFSVLLGLSTAFVFGASAVTWVANGVEGGPPLVGWTWDASALVLRILNILYAWMPELVLALLVSWCVRLLLVPLSGRIRSRFQTTSSEPGGQERSNLLASTRLPTLLASVALVTSLFVGAYPYLHAINPNGYLVGYDVRTLYLPFVKHMLSLAPSSAVYAAFRNDRTGFLLVEYLLSTLPWSAGSAAKVIPATLAAIFTGCTYFFVRETTRDSLVAATASLLAPLSLMAVSGINGGFDADWLAMCEALLMLALLLAGLNRGDRRYVASAIAVSATLTLTHPWTWTAMLGVLAAYALLTAAQALLSHERTGLRFELLSVGSIILVDLAVDGAKKLLIGVSGVADVISSTSGSASLSNVPTVLTSLDSSLRYFLGGALENWLIVVLAVVGVLTLPGMKNRLSRLMVSWVAVVSGGVFVYGYDPHLAPSLQPFFQSRLIMLAPIQVLGAMGFVSTLRYLAPMMVGKEAKNRRLVNAFIILAYVTVFAALMSYTLQNVGALYTGQ